MMSVRARLLIAMAALLLLPMFVTPIWRVYLQAPQYPEGIGMQIWINTVKGIKENDLDNINNLNHYIGMKRIEPDSIPELKYMPMIVVVLVGLGLIVAAFGKRWMILVWLALLTGAGTLGMYDFWLWEYDYGHNLDPHAIIKIEGMSYQPPLFGTEQLLNFTASSYPAIGFAFIALGGLLAVVAWWLSRQTKTSHT